MPKEKYFPVGIGVGYVKAGESGRASDCSLRMCFFLKRIKSGWYHDGIVPSSLLMAESRGFLYLNIC